MSMSAYGLNLQNFTFSVKFDFMQVLSVQFSYQTAHICDKDLSSRSLVAKFSFFGVDFRVDF